MFESIYIGLTGLTSFSRNLTVIGNNVSNINSPGFKGSQLSFSDLIYNSLVADRGEGAGSVLQIGNGVGSSGTRVLFKQGELRQTGNATDLAIDGNGFFVLRKDGKTTYTRSGEFEFDSGGFLVSRATGGRVAGLSSGALRDISMESRISPPQATSVLRFIDNLSTGSTTQDVNVTVFDSTGGSAALTVRFTNNNAVTPQSWLLEVRGPAGAVVSSGEIRFNGDGSPTAGFNTHAFTFAPAGAPAQSITLEFGAAGGFSGATNFSGGTTSTLRLLSQDGFGVGTLTQQTFDADGVLVATYSNGRTTRSQTLALAFFDSPQDLEAAGGSAFENRSGQRVTLGHPRDGVFGRIAAQSLESANVDLATEFGELIITQRGYQASSQVITTANEMIQQLFDIKSKR